MSLCAVVSVIIVLLTVSGILGGTCPPSLKGPGLGRFHTLHSGYSARLSLCTALSQRPIRHHLSIRFMATVVGRCARAAC